MKLNDNTDSIKSYLESFIVGKVNEVKIPIDNLRIISNSYNSLIKEISELKGFIIESKNLKAYSVWRKNKGLNKK